MTTSVECGVSLASAPLWRRFGAALVALLIVLGFATAPGNAREQEDDKATEQELASPTVRITNGTQFGGWTVACEAVAVNETTCVLQQRLVRSSDNTFLAEIVAFWDDAMADAFLAARVPNGAYLPSGFVMRLEDGDDRHEFAWQSCSRELCEALLAAERETLEAIDAGEGAVLGYRPHIQAEPLVFRTRTDGLIEGLDALKQALGRQG